MKGYEYRKALAEVLDEVHKQTIVKTLGRAGVKVTGGGWHAIEKAVNYFQTQVNPEANEYFSDVEYIGDNPKCHGAKVPIGPLFGETYTLTMSGRTRYIDDMLANARLGEDKFRRRIGLFKMPFLDTFPHFTSIYILRDIPPVAVHADAIVDILDKKGVASETTSDAEVIESAQKEYGSKGVEFVSEELAKRVIYALRTDASRVLNPADYYS